MISDTQETRRKFDLSHLYIDDKLQGSQLSSFPRRSIAFAVDWLIILFCTEYFSLLVPLALVFLVMKNRLRTTLVKSRRILKKNVRFADRKLETMAIDEKVRRQFRRHMTVYLYLIIYLPVVLASLTLVLFLLNYFSAETYETAKASVSGSLSSLFRPISDLNHALGLLVSFLGAFVYFTLFTWQWQGSTPGKRLMGIQVVRLNGKPISLWGSLERATGYTASTSLLGLGFFQYFWDRNCQTTHDKITETIVINA